MSVRTSNTVKTIEKDVEALSVGEEILYQVKVEDRFEEFDVISNGIDDLNLQRTVSSFTNLRDIDLGKESQWR
jgi:hypothetical protein